jgi:hypothetical protein
MQEWKLENEYQKDPKKIKKMEKNPKTANSSASK